ncbi:hypothetical protein AYK20_00500 [Thermoplasmatales archaeon SG8-52-1]|nr:MAG: hypothetical protein AYK20_00500 [Thermoplasmatales archaeon SG8-52-1]
MSIKKNVLTIRGSDFRKYFATSFGVHHTKRFTFLDIGNEKTKLPDGKEANVSDCQLIMDFQALKALKDLLDFEFKEIEKKYGKIKEDD